jgi:hypothetical protein
MFQSEAIVWLAAIPLVIGLGILFYGMCAPVAHADGWQPSGLAKPRIYGPLGVGFVSLAILMGVGLEYRGITLSSKPTLIGRVTYLDRVGRNGSDARFTLASDNGSFVEISTDRYMEGLKDGDRVQATVMSFNGDLLHLEVLTGRLAGRELNTWNRPMERIYGLVFACAFAYVGIGGRIAVDRFTAGKAAKEE